MRARNLYLLEKFKDYSLKTVKYKMRQQTGHAIAPALWAREALGRKAAVQILVPTFPTARIFTQGLEH